MRFPEFVEVIHDGLYKSANLILIHIRVRQRVRHNAEYPYVFGEASVGIPRDCHWHIIQLFFHHSLHCWSVEPDHPCATGSYRLFPGWFGRG